MLFVCSASWLFLLGCQYHCTSASEWLERLVSEIIEMTYNVLMGTLNPTHSLTPVSKMTYTVSSGKWDVEP